MKTKLQKVEEITFRVSDADAESGLNLVWKDGALYISLSDMMMTDGNVWYEVPFRSLEDIGNPDEGVITLIAENVSITLKGAQAERLMALRHLLLPLIERMPEDGELMRDFLKLLLVGIKDRNVISSLIKRDMNTVDELIDEAKSKGYISDGLDVTELGKRSLPRDVMGLLKRVEGEK